LQNFLKTIFPCFNTKQVKSDITPESTWELKQPNDGNPFKKKESYQIVVNEVRDGWVSYRMINGMSASKSDSCRVKTFLGIYEQIKD